MSTAGVDADALTRSSQSFRCFDTRGDDRKSNNKSKSENKSESESESMASHSHALLLDAQPATHVDMASFAAMLEADFATIESFARMTAPSTHALLCPSAASSVLFASDAVDTTTANTPATPADADAQAMRSRKRPAASTQLLDTHAAVMTCSDDSSSGAESSTSSSTTTRASATSSSSTTNKRTRATTEAPTMPKTKKKPWYAMQKVRANER